MIERNADVLEDASNIHQRMNDEGREVSANAIRPQFHPDFDGKHCVEADCGVELPPVRLAYKWIRCTTCQGAVEKRLRLQGRR